MTVLEWLEENEKKVPQRVTVKRTRASSYQFHLVVRHMKMRTQKAPQFASYTKASAMVIKAGIEEHSFFSSAGLHALEGFPRAFVESIKLRQGDHLVAEVEDGELETESFSYKTKRGILRALIQQLELDYSLRELLKLDWSEVPTFEEIEVILRRAKVVGWTEGDVANHLNSRDRKGILAAIKRANAPEILRLIERMGPQGSGDHLVRLLTQLVYFNAMRAMGMDAIRAAREMNLGRMRAEEIEEAARMMTADDISVLTERVLDLTKYPSRLGMEILMLNCPFAVGRK